MALDAKGSNVDDPLSRLSVFSLLPRTIGAATSSASTSAANGGAPPSTEAEVKQVFRRIFESMGVKGPEQVSEQARSTTNGQAESQESQNINLDQREKNIELNRNTNLKERRPAPGRKRGRFSLMPDVSSDMAQNVDFSSLDQIGDPLEFFLTSERLEVADKELKRLRGEVSIEPTQAHVSINPRKNRTDNLRRKSCYTYDLPAIDEISKGVGFSEPQKSNPVKNSDTSEKEDAPTGGEEKTDGILDKLLSSFKDVGEGEEEALLWESLNLEPVELGHVELPQFPTIPRENSTGSSSGTTTTPKEKSPGSRISEVLKKNLASNSTFTAIQTLKKRISPKISEKDDPYAVILDDDGGMVENSSRSAGPDRVDSVAPDKSENAEVLDDKENHVPTDEQPFSNPTNNQEVEELVSREEQTIPVVNNVVPDNQVTEASQSAVHGEEIPNSSETTMRMTRSRSLLTEKNKKSKTSTDELVSTGREFSLEREGLDMQKDALVSDKPNHEIQDSSFVNSGTAVHEKHASSNEQVPEVPLETAGHEKIVGDHSSNPSTVCLSGAQLDGNAELARSKADKMKSKERKGRKRVTTKKQKKKASGSKRKTVADNSSHPSTFASVDEELENPPATSAGNLVSQEQVQAGPTESPRRGNNQKVPSKRKKDADRRKSLAGAGLVWQSGVRRSTRVKSRPLKHWLGERFLYGRIHDSLATVIGVKTLSPGSNSKGPVMKVKSFVSDQYSDLVAQVSK